MKSGVIVMTEREEKAQAWLNRNYALSLELEAVKRRLERMESDLEKVCKPIRLKEVQEAQGLGNGVEDRLAEYMDMSADLQDRMQVLIAKDEQTMQVIIKVDSPMLRAILIERYINRLRWREMCTALHFERSRLFDLHVQALDAVLPFIPEEAK